MRTPYDDLSAEAFWKTGVVAADRERMPGLYVPRFEIGPETAVATAGSCFAQHITRTLRRAGATVLDAEAPPRAMPEKVQRRYGYGLFSGRYGNIYTARQMRQLLEEVADGAAEARFVWEREGRFHDAFRPTVEPEGLESAEEVLLHRDYHLARTLRMLQRAEVLVFTLGLTEAWADRETGRVFPVCPGVVAGRFDPLEHALVTFRHGEVVDDLAAIRALLQRFNPGMKLLLTVSPVPLTATARPHRHVLDATAEAKATLRSAAAEFVADHADAAYFPSYELVMHPGLSTDPFEANLRTVRPEIVDRVMALFLDAHDLLDGVPAAEPTKDRAEEDGDDTSCDELLLQAFAR